MNEQQMKAIIGGIFGTGTYTEFTADGEAVEKKEKFNIRLYKDLWHSGAIKKLKGNKLAVWLTIAIHANNDGEGWPSQRTIASLLGLNKDTVTKALISLEKDGFIERTLTIRDKKTGKFQNTRYKIKFAPDSSSPEKQDREKSNKNQQTCQSEKIGLDNLSEKTGTGKTSAGKTGHKNNNLLEEPSLKNTSKYVSNSYQNVFDRFAENYQLTGHAKREVKNMIEEYGELLTIEALEQTVTHEPRYPVAYMSGVLRKWDTAGVKTKEDVIRYIAKHDEKQQTRKTSSKKKQLDKSKQQSTLPSAIQQQLDQTQKEAVVAQEETKSKISKAEMKAKQEQIQEKLKVMNDSLHAWMSQQNQP